MSKKPNWRLLKDNRCPDCGSYLEEPEEDIYGTSMKGCADCEFKIGLMRFEELVKEMYKNDSRGIAIHKRGQIDKDFNTNQEALNRM